MAKIEPALHEHFAKAREAGVSPPPMPSVSRAAPASASAGPRVVTMGGGDSELTLRPFAKVNSVVVGSPADGAGLRAGDEVLKFGDVDWTSADKLARVAATTGRNEGVSAFGPLEKSELRLILMMCSERSKSGYRGKLRAAHTQNTWSFPSPRDLTGEGGGYLDVTS